jgi:glyoxylase-like metal-dependent hydrolase (beta-lactamase superfamily II)
MTLDGTNTWVLRDPNSTAVVVVDPGPDDPAHLSAVAAAGGVSTILLTHGHPDHSAGARRLYELTGAPVRAFDTANRIGSLGLTDGEVIEAAGVELRVWVTPGHTADSVSFVLERAGGPQAVVTGDTVLGRGTTVVAYPDGDLGDYLWSLRRLRQLGDVVVLPGHGCELPAAAPAIDGYLAHREMRLAQVRDALGVFGRDVSPRTIVERLYADLDPALWPAAELTVRAQLAYLREQEG